MNIAYLANIRFPSNRAHSIQIEEMCRAFASLECNVNLYIRKKCDSNERPFLITRVPTTPIVPSIKPTFYVSEFFLATIFILKGIQRKSDYIYIRSEWIAWFMSWWVPNHKIIWESHEAKFNLPARRVLNSKIKVVVISEGIFEIYRKENVPAKKMLIAHDGIDESFFAEVASKHAAREKLDLPVNKKIIMYIGGFDAWKGVDTFFEAAKLNNNKDNLFVAIGGSKDEIITLREQYPEVTFLGFRPYERLKDFQQAADILVVPNTAKNQLSSIYTSPLKIFAHMASGVPLLISDIPSLVTIAGRENVKTFVADDERKLLQSVDEIMNNYALWVKKAGVVKKTATNFTWRKRAQKILQFIEGRVY